MKHLPFDTAHQWLTRLAAHPGRLTLDRIALIAVELGWEPTDSPTNYFYRHGSDAPRISALKSTDTKELHNVSFSLARNMNNDLPGNILIADLYADYIKAATHAWGPPTDHTTDTTAAIWKLHDHAYINIHTWPHAIRCSFETDDPNYLG